MSPLSHELGGEVARIGIGGAARINEQIQVKGRDGVLGGLRLRDLRDEQRFQDAQGRDDFKGLLIEVIEPSAPATANVHVPSTKGGVSGPYPWRRPV